MLYTSLIERYPDTFGGMYYEDLAAVVVQVLNTPDAEALFSEAVEHLTAYSPVGKAPSVRAVTVRNSHTDLVHLVRRVQGDRTSITAQGATVFDVALDQRRNRVVAVFIDTPSDVQARIVSAYGTADVIVSATTTGGRRKL